MTLKLDRRTLLRFSGAASALGCLPLTAWADDKTGPASSGPPPIEIYAATPQVDNIALSPDGKRVAVISQTGDDKMLIYFDVAEPTGKSIRLGPAKIRNLFWGSNDHVVIVDSQTTSLPQFTGSKQELSLARVLDLRTVKMRTLFDKEEDFYGIVMGPVYRVKIDGAYQLMAANYRMTGEYNYCLYQFPLDTGRGKLAFESSRDTEGFVVAPDGYLVAYSEFNEMRKEWRLYYNMAPRGKMENFKNVAPEWANPDFDPGRKYSVPWAMGIVGTVVNTDVYNGDINTWAIIFNPPEELKGKINVVPEMTDVMDAAILYNGGKKCTGDLTVLKKVRDTLLAAKPYWVAMEYGTIQKMGSGDFAASSDWNGSAFRQRLANPKIHFGYPKEGFVNWSDNLVVLKEAKNVENAKLFQNFMMDPENAGMNSGFHRYANGIAGSEKFMPADMKDAPEIKVPDEFKSVGVPSQTCPPDVQALYTKIWTELQK